MLQVTVLPGLPAYGPMATAFPADWGRRGHEGFVVEFKTAATTWVGNFADGFGGIRLASVHPNQRDAVVIAGGDLWIVDPEARTSVKLLSAIDQSLEVNDPDGWVFSKQGLALARLGPEGLLWHTRRLSWDGFDKLEIGEKEIQGLAYSPFDDQWHRFRVDLRTGESTGGSYGTKDTEGWEKIHH